MSIFANLVQGTLHCLGFEMRRYKPHGDLGRFFGHLRQLQFRPQCILDVGANRGEWAAVARQAFPDARFLLIEPQPELVPQLEAFVKHAPGSKWVSAGAGPQPGQLQLTVWDDKYGSSFLPTGTEPAHRDKPRVTVPIITLDEACRDAGMMPDLAKLDIQGYELEALRGGESLFGKTELFLLEVSLYPYIEKWPTLAEVVRFFDERGYAVYDLAGQSRRPLDGALGQVDLVFARKQGRFMADPRWSSQE